MIPHVASLRTGLGAGSTAVVTDDGLMLTNAHVVGNVRNGVAVFTDGTESRFDVVGVNPLSDLLIGTPAPLSAPVAQWTGQTAGAMMDVIAVPTKLVAP